MTLTERLACPAKSPPTTSDDEEQVRRAHIRLARWRSTHDLAATGQFARRLASVGISEGDLLVLLRERPASLAARTAKPVWAHEVERIVGRAGSRASADGLPWQAAFTVIVAPFVEDARSRLASEVDRLGGGFFADTAHVVDRFARTLCRSLVWSATRILVLEVNVARVTGLLDGANPEDRFAAFARRGSTQQALTALLTEYPVLARLLHQMGDTAVAAFTELLHRFADDRDDIVRELLGGTDPGPLAEVDTGVGDAHQRGRSVAVLHFTSGACVVYKPRPLTAHLHFNGVVAWLDSVLPQLGLRTLHVLDRRGWGWVEFAAHQPVSSTGEVERFHYRQGALLALLYVLDGTDQHFENLIACGDQPVLVDVETLFHPGLAHHTLVADPAARVLESSVLRTALLPQLMVGDNGVLDMSGVGGDKGMPLPDDVVGFDASGTDRMRLIRRPDVSPGADNRLRLHGVDVDPQGYVDHLVAGFRAAYDAIRAHRTELVGPDGPLGAFATDDVRVIVRDTVEYARLLDESTHPDVMRDALDRDRVFDHLWALSESDPVREGLIGHELEDLWAGDVPLFTTTPTSRDLWAGGGKHIPDALSESGMDRVVRKIGGMGFADRRTQEWIIRASFATRGNPNGHAAGTSTTGRTGATIPDAERLLATARGIADEIVAGARGDGERVNWLGFEYVDDRSWSILPLGASLSNGYPGVALFLSQLADVTGDDRYADVARRAVGAVPWLLGRLGSGNVHVANGVAGLGGLAYALSHLAVRMDDPDLFGWTEAAVDQAAARIDTDETFDIMGGSAGCLAAMLAVHQATGLDSAWRAAVACAERLVPACDRPSNGFAHGSGGIGWALWRFAAAGGGPRFRELGLAVFANGSRTSGHTWCNGSSGIGLARTDILRLEQDPRMVDDLDRAVDDVLRHRPAANHSLCHGELGTLELITAAAARGHDFATAERRRRIGALLSSIDQHGPLSGTPGGVGTPGLLTGLAGIGHGLLRLGFPDRVPSVLLLEAARLR